MGNDKVQPEKKELEKRVRVSVIRKTISRTLTTAKYESIKIEDSIEETVEWSDLEERDRKIKNWETIMLQQYKQSHDRILEELNLSHKKAYFNNHLDTDDRPDPHADGDVNAEFLDKLDALE